MASQIIDDQNIPAIQGQKEVMVSAEFINSRLGFNLEAEDIVTILENVEFIAEITLWICTSNKSSVLADRYRNP